MSYVTTNLVFLFVAVTHQNGLPQGLLSAVCWQESHHKPAAVNKNDGGEDSLGLCQIKESTARDMGFQGKREELMRPETNMLYAAKYLRKMVDRYDGNIPKALAAYNAGPKNVKINGPLMYRKYPIKVMQHWSDGK